MPRGLSSNIKTFLLNNTNLMICDLLKIEFAAGVGGTQYHTNAGHTVIYNSDSYVSTDLTEVGGTPQTLDLKLKSWTFTLTTVDNTNLTPALNSTFEGVTVTLYKAILDESTGQIKSSSGTDLVWEQEKGEIESFEVNEGTKTSTITYNVSDQLIRYDRLRARRTNSQEQDSYFSGDKGLDFVGQYKEIKWGREK